MAEKEFIIFCDESDVSGQYYSNFYGGVLVGGSQYDRVTKLLEKEKQRLNLFGEVKWEKVSEPYEQKYRQLMSVFFNEVRSGNLRVRIMFRQNAHHPIGLTADQIEGVYFRLYYQFIKHAFGLQYATNQGQMARLRLYFDEFPRAREEATQFKGFLLGLNSVPGIRNSGLSIAPESIAEIRSHDHVLAQCLDVVLGAMSFRLNDKHLAKPPGAVRRGKRTIAKEKVFKSLSGEIRAIRPGLNIGESTGTRSPGDRWSAPYLHWKFIPTQFDFQHHRTKQK
jgi:hypothetical protein